MPALNQTTQSVESYLENSTSITSVYTLSEKQYTHVNAVDYLVTCRDYLFRVCVDITHECSIENSHVEIWFSDKHMFYGTLQQARDFFNFTGRAISVFDESYKMRNQYAKPVTQPAEYINLADYRCEPDDLYATNDARMIELYSLVDADGEHIDESIINGIQMSDVVDELQTRFNLPLSIIQPALNNDMIQISADTASIQIFAYTNDSPQYEQAYRELMSYIA
jgi:hypothetical protein